MRIFFIKQRWFCPSLSSYRKRYRTTSPIPFSVTAPPPLPPSLPLLCHCPPPFNHACTPYQPSYMLRVKRSITTLPSLSYHDRVCGWEQSIYLAGWQLWRGGDWSHALFVNWVLIGFPENLIFKWPRPEIFEGQIELQNFLCDIENIER